MVEGFCRIIYGAPKVGRMACYRRDCDRCRGFRPRAGRCGRTVRPGGSILEPIGGHGNKPYRGDPGDRIDNADDRPLGFGLSDSIVLLLLSFFFEQRFLESRWSCFRTLAVGFGFAAGPVGHFGIERCRGTEPAVLYRRSLGGSVHDGVVERRPASDDGIRPLGDGRRPPRRCCDTLRRYRPVRHEYIGHRCGHL